MTRFIKIILLTVTVLVICFGTYLLLTKQKTIEIGENKDQTVYLPDTSFIYIPVSLSMNGLLTGLNEKLPEIVLDKSFSIGGGNINTLIKRKGEITSAMDSGFLKVKLPFKFKLKYEASGKSNPLLNFVSSIPLEFENEIQLSIPISINSDLNLTTLKDKINIDWEPLPALNIPGFDFDIQSVLEKALFSEGGVIYEWIIKDFLEKTSLKQYITDSWKHFQMEIPVSSAEDGFFIRSQPIGITAWYAGGKKDSLFVGLKIASRFVVMHESELKNEPILVIPDNIAIENKGYFNDTSIFSVKVDLPLKAMNEITLRYLQDADLSYKGFKLSIDDIDFKNGKNTVYVTINYSGNLKGEMILKGTPYVDPETRIFTLKNLGLQNKSSNLIVTSADRVLNEYLVGKMKEAIQFDLGAAVDSLPKMFQSSLTELSSEQGVNTKIQQMKLDKVDIHLTQNNIQMIVNGRAKFFVTPRHYNFDFEKILEQ